MDLPASNTMLEPSCHQILMTATKSYLGLIIGISKVMFSTTVAFSSQGFWEA